MPTKNYSIQVDLKNKIPTIPITLVQGDVSSNIFNISITEDGSAVDLTGSTVTITMQKPDNTVVVGNCTLISPTNGTIQYICGTNDIAAIGTVTFTISIYNNGAKVTSTQGKFKVISELDNGQAAQSTTSYGVLDNLIAQVNSSENTRQANEAIRQSNENTRLSNETTRQSNETTRVNNETTRQANETTRVNNEATRQSNEVTRQNSESARIAAENTRINNENIRVTSEVTRVTAENIRLSSENTRVSNEITRQNQESTRVNTFNTNEATRQSTFSFNETTRQNTFNTNEATRQANETVRETMYNQFETFVNSTQQINRIPYLFDGGDFGDTSTAVLSINGGDF